MAAPSSSGLPIWKMSNRFVMRDAKAKVSENLWRPKGPRNLSRRWGGQPAISGTGRLAFTTKMYSFLLSSSKIFGTRWRKYCPRPRSFESSVWRAWISMAIRPTTRTNGTLHFLKVRRLACSKRQRNSG